MSNCKPKHFKETEKVAERLKFCDLLKCYIEEKLKEEELKRGSIEVLNKEFLQDSLQYIIESYRFEKILKYIDFSGISCEGLNFAGKWTLTETNINIDPQIVKNKTIAYSNLENIDMSNKDFNNVCIQYTNLNNTNSLIDLENLWGSIEGTNLNSCTCVININSKKDIIIDDHTIIDDTLFVEKNSYDKENDAYQIIAKPVVKELLKKR